LEQNDYEKENNNNNNNKKIFFMIYDDMRFTPQWIMNSKNLVD